MQKTIDRYIAIGSSMINDILKRQGKSILIVVEMECRNQKRVG